MDMPVMNGVTLTAEIKKRYPDMIVIACSAFDDFHFVKESMRLGAEDYILKQDFDGEQIIQTLQNILKKKRIQRKKEIRENYARDALLDFLNEKSSQLPETIPGYLRIRTCKSVTVILIYNKTSTTTLYEHQDLDVLLLTKLDEAIWLLLIEKPMTNSSKEDYQWSSRITNLLSGYFDGTTQLGLCDDAGDVEKLPGMYQKAREALAVGFYYPREKVFHYLDYGTMNNKATEPVTIAAGEDADPETLGKKLRQSLLESKPEEAEVNRILASVLTEQYHRKGIPEENLNFYEEVQKRYFLEEKLECLKNWLEKAEDHSYEGNHPEIRSAIRYIQNHIAEDISLGEIAACVGLSDNYFSNLFKQEMGENLTAFVNRIRIEKAKQLLDTSNLKVYEIAEKVGFRNTTYFSTTFKKLVGISVSEYKSR